MSENQKPPVEIVHPDIIGPAGTAADLHASVQSLLDGDSTRLTPEQIQEAEARETGFDETLRRAHRAERFYGPKSS